MSVIKNVAIIGAGISGLSCAESLQKCGFDVTVFEKSRGPSGRLSTRINENRQFDHGAQYFTARDLDFYNEVQRWIKADVACLWNPRLQVTDGINYANKQLEIERFVGIPTNTSPAHFLAQSLNVKTEYTVIEIKRCVSGWQLNTKEHGWYDKIFDIVVLAIPAPQAHFLLKSPIERLAKIASSVKMRGCWALMCHFDYSLPLGFDGLFINNQILSWMARDSAKPNRKNLSKQEVETWVIHANATWSEAHIEDEAESVAETMMDAFIKLGGDAPLGYTVHRWRYADCENYLKVGYLWDEDTHFGLCGDWLNGGKVQGAWLSGNALAKKIELMRTDSMLSTR